MTRAKRRAALYLVPALAVVLAARQFYLAHAYALTPWKGGGFGMFASVDNPRLRFIRAYLVTPAGEVPVDVSASTRIDQLAKRARYMPSPGRMNRLADAVLQARWVVDTTPARRARIAPTVEHRRGVAADSAAAPEPAGPRVAASAVRLEAWRVHFDTRSQRVLTQKLAEVTRRRS